MSLVAAYSDSEEESDQGEEFAPLRSSKQLSGFLPHPKIVTDVSKCNEGSTSHSMFGSLPAPKRDIPVTIIEEDEVIPVKQKVKISIPSLSELQEEDAPKPKKPKPLAKGSGLLSILPEPKNSKPSRAMVPHILTKKSVPPKPKSVKRPPIKHSQADSDDDSGDDSAADFFSLTNQNIPEPADISLEELLPKAAGPARPHPSQIPVVPVEIPVEEEASSATQELQLDAEAMRQLCGHRAQKGGEEMNIIELHGDNMMPDPKEWMLKSMTAEQQSTKHRDSQPSSAHKRKHQITYLAFQAKEREIELKNQWAANRYTRKQTQAKYGF